MQKDIKKRLTGSARRCIIQMANRYHMEGRMRFLVSVTEQMHSRLKAESKRRGQTLTGLIREILWDWLQTQESA